MTSKSNSQSMDESEITITFDNDELSDSDSEMDSLSLNLSQMTVTLSQPKSPKSSKSPLKQEEKPKPILKTTPPKSTPKPKPKPKAKAKAKAKPKKIRVNPVVTKVIDSLLQSLEREFLQPNQPPRHNPPSPPLPPTSISYFTRGLQTSFSVPNHADMTARFQSLRDLKLPEQRTEEWYQFRNNRLTASDLGMLFGTKSEYQTCLLRKCRTLTEVKSARSGGGAACRHGIKYEDVAIGLYEYRNSVRVHDFGCIPHRTLSCFAASPDGICDTSNPVYAGRMLEIKCPYSRLLGPTVNPHPIKDVYWAQMQGQLEVCDLPYCDFLECIIKEYPTESDFWNDSDGSGRCQANGLEKGIVATHYPDTTRQKFSYSPLGVSPDTLREWCQKMNRQTPTTIFTYWRLDQYVCRLVARNPDWWSQVQPHIEYFWDQVVHYRENSKYHLYPQKIQKKNTRRF